MDLTRLTRASYRQNRPAIGFLGRFSLAGARAHELCGGARRRLALWIARDTQGPVIWIRPKWHPDRLHLAGACAEIDPARLLFVEPLRADDLLWSMEEALRAGVAPMVVADLTDPPSLVAVRRLHLAAEAGAAQTQMAALALLLLPGDGGAPGIETRWRLESAHGAPDRQGWRLSRLRARQDPPGDWDILPGTGKPAAAAPLPEIRGPRSPQNLEDA